MKWFKDSRVIIMLTLVMFIGIIWKLDSNGMLVNWVKVILAGDVDNFKKIILDLGVWGPLAVILMLVLQAVIPPIPAFVVIVVAYWVYGPYWGFVYSLLGSQLGAIATYWLAKCLGRPFVIKWVGGKQLQQVDYYFDKYGGYAVFLARIVPILSVDAITYAAGASNMKFRKFMIATVCGQIPALLIFAFMGSKAANLFEYIGYLTIAGIVTFAIGYLLKKAAHVDANANEISQSK